MVASLKRRPRRKGTPGSCYLAHPAARRKSLVGLDRRGDAGCPRRPLEIGRIPRVCRGNRAPEPGVEQIVRQYYLGPRKEEGPESGHLIHRRPVSQVLVREDASRHVHEEAHGEVEDVESYERDHEVQLPEALAVHPAAHPGKPVVHGCEEPEDGCADHDVVEVGDDEVGPPEYPVEDGRGEEYAHDPPDDEEDDGAQREQEWRLELNPPADQGEDERDDDDDEGYRYQLGRHVEHLLKGERNPGQEHVVHPDSEAEWEYYQSGRSQYPVPSRQ